MALTRAQYLAPGGSSPALAGQVQGVKQGTGITIAADGTISFNAGSATGVVTSVAASGGTTGLTFSGSPITSSGTLTLGGVLAIANGGTGSSTSSGGLNNLLPSQAGNAGRVLSTNGTNVLWAVDGGGTVTSVNASGGTTGLFFNGGPITTSGTLQLNGVLAIAHGGTGASTSSGSINNLLPPQTGNAGSFLTTNGSNISWGTVSINNLLPPQTGNAGRFLTTNGSNISWGTVAPGGVTQIIAGSNVTISPVTGTGAVTINSTASGGVTSVNASGGTTGLTFSGGPITTSGTLTLGGVLGISNGGTGSSNANSALNALLPSQTGNSGRVLTTDGSNVSWEGGGPFPNTTINFPTTIPGTANSTAWLAPNTTLSATDCIEFSVNGSSFSQGPTLVSQGQTVTTRWIQSGVCGDAPTGTVLIGEITGGAYSVSGSITINRLPSGFAFDDLTSQPLSSLVTSNPIIPGNYNSTAYVTLLGGTTLTGVEASVGGGAFTAIPSTATLPINPGQSLQIRGTTGFTPSTTYTARILLGIPGQGYTDIWTVTTAAPDPAISQPSILTPPSGTTGLNPSAVDPPGITLTASSYDPLNGAGAQTSSTWEVTSGSPGGTPIPGSPFTRTSAPFTTQFIPRSSLATSTIYYARVQYATTNSQAATSAFSGWSSFGTSSSFAIPPGTVLGGGYFGGQINDGGTIYNLIVAPVTGTGGQQGQYGGSTPALIQYKTTNTADGGVTQDVAYGAPATAAFADGNHPVFNWCVNGANGPRSNGGIGGFTDWYIPARHEFLVLYFFLKPDTQTNSTLSGNNPNSVAPYEPNTRFGPGYPNQTTSTLFQSGGAQAFTVADPYNYWSTTEGAAPNNALSWTQVFGNGQNTIAPKTYSYYARAIRRVAA